MALSCLLTSFSTFCWSSCNKFEFSIQRLPSLRCTFIKGSVSGCFSGAFYRRLNSGVLETFKISSRCNSRLPGQIHLISSTFNSILHARKTSWALPITFQCRFRAVVARAFRSPQTVSGDWCLDEHVYSYHV
jgi:hypothetical protein